ncbi:hypothetical protein KAI31_02135 [Candidatus Bathyarchaeota archaeon]|nr:hypothetical protein [Candidatus Bathyarchaeota archaeon]
MIEDVKLRLVKMKLETKETKEGEVQQEVFVLKGFDKANGVELSITLKADEALPVLYQNTIGAHIGNQIMVSLGKSTRQTEL